MKKKIFFLIVALAALSLAVMFFALWSDSDIFQNVETQDTAIAPLDEASCVQSAGNWNPCGSACRTQPDAVCIELCVEYCECSSDTQCPSGYVCGDFVEGIGVCL